MRELKTTSTEGLLDAIIQLTHRIHAAPELSLLKFELRDQRDLVKQEVLTRCAEPAK